MCYLSVKRSGERASDTVLFTSENNDIANQSVDASFFTSEKNRMTNQLASLARRDYFYLDAFWRVNLGMYIIIIGTLRLKLTQVFRTCKERTQAATKKQSSFIQFCIHFCIKSKTHSNNMNFYRITFLFLFKKKWRAEAVFSCHSQLWKSNKVNLSRKNNSNGVYIKGI